MNRPSADSVNAGSILVDVMVGTAIIAAGLFSVWVSLATISGFITLDRQRADARVALTSQLDTVRGTVFDQIRIGTPSVTVATLPSGQLTQAVTAVTDDLRQIELTASWITPAGPRTVTVATRVARGGISGN